MFFVRIRVMISKSDVSFSILYTSLVITSLILLAGLCFLFGLPGSPMVSPVYGFDVGTYFGSVHKSVAGTSSHQP